MANICDFELKVIGKTKADIHHLLEALKANSGDLLKLQNSEHMFRIGDVRESTSGYKTVGCGYSLVIRGYCAWSVRTCMFDGTNTYYRESKAPNKTTLPNLCRKYGLFVEIYSREEGMGFEEHYVINEFGTIKEEECVEVRTEYDEETGICTYYGGFSDGNGKWHFGAVDEKTLGC